MPASVGAARATGRGGELAAAAGGGVGAGDDGDDLVPASRAAPPSAGTAASRGAGEDEPHGQSALP